MIELQVLVDVNKKGELISVDFITDSFSVQYKTADFLPGFPSTAVLRSEQGEETLVVVELLEDGKHKKPVPPGPPNPPGPPTGPQIETKPENKPPKRDNPSRNFDDDGDAK